MTYWPDGMRNDIARRGIPLLAVSRELLSRRGGRRGGGEELPEASDAMISGRSIALNSLALLTTDGN